MALSEIFSNISKDLREAPLIGAQSMKANIELQNLIEEQNARKGLQELFKKNAAPTVSEIGSIAPGMVPDYLKNQFANQTAMQGMQKNAMEMQKMHFENNARVFGPIAEQAIIDRQNGDPQWETKYNVNMGNAARYIVESGGKLPQNFDAELHKPELILRNANTILGQQSSYFKNQQELEMERSKRMMPPAMPADLYYPTKSRTELDPVTHAPVTIPGQPGLGAGNVQPNYVKIAPTQQDLDQLIEMQKASNNPAEKAQIGTYIADIQKQLKEKASVSSPPVATGRTPEEIADIAAKTEAAKIQAKLTTEEKIADKRSIENYFRSKPPEQVRDLIRESIEGDLESGISKIAKVFGVAIPGADATAQLQVITQQLAKSSPFAPGSQSDKEYQARLQAVGDPASNEPIKNRLAALDEFYRDQEAFVAQKAEMTPEQLIDAVHNGYLSEESAKTIFKRMNKSSGAK